MTLGMTRTVSTLIAGAGYLGGRLAHRAAERGESVIAIRRRPPGAAMAHFASQAAGIRWWDYDLASVDDRILEQLLPFEISRMVISVAPGGRRINVMNMIEDVVPDGVASRTASVDEPVDKLTPPVGDPFLDALKGATRIACELGIQRVVYTSSTGVYTEENGGIVDERSPIFGPDATDVSARIADPAEENRRHRQRLLVEAEQFVRDELGNSVTIARLSGIYGPGRDPRPRYLLSDHLPAKTDFWTSRIHVEDAASAIELLLETAPSGLIVNISDNEPALASKVARWCLEHGSTTENEGANSMISFSTAGRSRSNKRVSNERLRELGWRPLYSSFREGFSSLPNSSILSSGSQE